MVYGHRAKPANPFRPIPRQAAAGGGEPLSEDSRLREIPEDSKPLGWGGIFGLGDVEMVTAHNWDVPIGGVAVDLPLAVSAPPRHRQQTNAEMRPCRVQSWVPSGGRPRCPHRRKNRNSPYVSRFARQSVSCWPR